jgi:N-acetylmuramoyl-L-alanine amidase
MPNIITHPRSPNFSDREIAVEFVVLHYTACSLAHTLEIFYDPSRKVCSQFVIDEGGAIHDLGGFWNGPILQGAHAGVSRFEIQGRVWEALNTCSVGIEMVNFNGNIFPYPDGQYAAVIDTLKHLTQRFPALQDPHRIVGHEQIAGFRGKADPGHCFDWQRVFVGVYGARKDIPQRPPRLSSQAMAGIKRYIDSCSSEETAKPEFWSHLSEQIESGTYRFHK